MQKVLILGLGPTAPTAIRSLAERFEVVGIIGESTTETNVDSAATEARRLGVPLLTDVSLSGIEATVSRLRPDCTIVSSYNKILPDSVLRHGRMINVHYAPLPRYRGRAVVNWAIINGETACAITIHTISSGLDAGRVLYQRQIPVTSEDTVSTVYARLNAIQEKVLGHTVERHLAGFDGERQDEALATYCCTRVPADGVIDWSDGTAGIHALIRALGPPYPWAHTYLETRRLDVLRAQPLRPAPLYVGRIPGRVVARSVRDGHVDVLTGDGVMRLHEVALGGAGAPASEVITSTKQTLGLHVEELLSRIESLEATLRALTSGVDATPDGPGS